jgi:hypothetical protein
MARIVVRNPVSDDCWEVYVEYKFKYRRWTIMSTTDDVPVYEILEQVKNAIAELTKDKPMQKKKPKGKKC